MIQYIIVILIGIVTVIYVLHKLFRCFFDKKYRVDKCENCSGCVLKSKKEDE